LVGRGSGVLLDGHAKFIKLAGVLAVFGSDSFGDRLHTFELRAGVEIAALFAAVQFGLALGTGSVGIEAGSENGTAGRTTRAGDGADHSWSARTEVIVLPARTAGGRALLRAGFSFFFFVLAVTAMAVLAIHKRLRASGLLSVCSDYIAAVAGQAESARDVADLHLQNEETGCFFRLHRAFSSPLTPNARNCFIQSDCYTRAGNGYCFQVSESKECQHPRSRRWDNFVFNSLGV